MAALTINKVCGSGLKAVGLAAQSIQTGNAEIVVAGGMESMSNAPYLLPQGRQGFRMGDSTVVDSMVHDGLWDVYNHYHMGMTAENVAAKHSISRADQDRFAMNSHRKATEAGAATSKKKSSRSRYTAPREGRPPSSKWTNRSGRIPR